MEILVIASIIIVLLLILGVPTMTIIAGIFGLLALFSVLCNVFFIIMFILLCFTRQHDASFLRIEKKKEKIPYAFYLIDGEEYSNMFPTDMILSNVFYRKDKVTVRIKSLNKKMLVFDSVTQIIIILGLLSFSIMTLLFSSFI